MEEKDNIPEEENSPTNQADSSKEDFKVDSIFAGTLNLSGLQDDLQKVRNEMKKYLIGQHELVDLMLVATLSEGHILLEGVPGIAKTLAAKLMAHTIDADFSRIQFTPDLMPSDIIGTSVFNMKTSAFTFQKGPIFSNVILIDEINRAPAKTQSALFEVMEEKQITVDGETYDMKFPFMVVATQNPVEHEGTYRLPEAQLDRFLFRILLDYPTVEEEQAIMNKFNSVKKAAFETIEKVIKPKKLKEYRELIGQVRVEPSIVKYIAQITHETRNHGSLYLGASPRASLAMMHASKAFAALRGRDFVVPDDIQYVAPHVLNHRIILNPESEMEGLLPQQVISEIVSKVEVPR